MVTYRAGNFISGTATQRGNLSTGSLQANLRFFETDTDDMYQWDGDSWNLMSGNTVAETLSSKTLTSPVLNTGISGSAVKDEDNMASDSATHVATQQSIKAYVDSTSGTVTVTDNESTNENNLVTFVANAATSTGTHGLEMDGNLHYNPSTGALTSTGFTGALTGNATTATTLETARTIGGVSFNGSANINLPGVNTAGSQNTSGTATNSTNVTVTDNESTNEDNLITFVAGAATSTGNHGLEMDGNLIYNPSTGRLTATQLGGTLQTASQTNITSVGALSGGSISSGFGAIDNGASTITTTGLISGGSLDIDSVLINGSTIGHTDDTDLITVANGIVTIAGEVSVTTLDIGGTNVTSTAAELNLLDGVSGLVQADLTKLAAIDSTAAEINLLNGVSGLVQADLTKLAAIDATAAEIDLLDALDRGSIIYGNSIGATAVLGQGGADTVLTSDGTDISWAAIPTASTITISANNSTDETVYPIFVDGATGGQGLESDTGLTYNPSTGVLTSTTFTGALSGNATTSTSVTVTDNESTNENNLIAFVADAGTGTGNHGLEMDGNLHYNPSSGTVTATTFVGNLTGNVTGDTSGSSGSTTGNAATATLATSITATANNLANETVYLTFVDGATGTQGIETDTGLSYNPSTGNLTATTFNGTMEGTATSATKVTVTDNESTNENDLIPFVENAGAGTGTHGLEMDGDFHYNPSTGRLTATQLSGTLQTAAQTNITSVGALNAGSITSGFTSIDVGSGAITTTGTVTAGNLTVNGTTTTVNSTTVTIDDPIFTLGGDSAPGSDDNKDRGIEFRWHNGSAAKIGFFGFDDSTGKFTFIPDATNSSEVFSGTAGTIVAALEGNASTATALATARTIGGTSFDGTANIAVALAATATTLASARTIGGVSFDGSANINLPGVNAAGSQDTSGTAALATEFTATANNTANETVYPVFIDGVSGAQGAETDSGLTYNPSTGVITATQFTGAVSGNATTATTATNATHVNVADNESTNENNLITFIEDASATGNVGLESDGDFHYNPSTGTVTATTFAGALTGNASTATALANARTIGGTSFDGTANIAVALAATATTLATARTIGGTSFDGSANIAVALSATATTLANARTIGGTSFDGSVNIVPATITVADTTDISSYVALFESATGDLAPKTDAGITYNAGTGVLTATGFSGPLTGNVTGNVSGSAGSATGNAATATEATNVTAVANNSTDETVYPTFVDGATGTQGIETDTGLTYNPSSGILTSTQFTGAVSGNATTATALASGRTIGMTGDVVWTSASFNGSGNVTGSAVIQATSVENSMLAGSIADSKLNTISTAGKVDLAALEIDGGTDIGEALVDADLFIVDNGAGGTNRKMAASRIKTYIGAADEGFAIAMSVAL